jgi:hypothetical protein
MNLGRLENALLAQRARSRRARNILATETTYLHKQTNSLSRVSTIHSAALPSHFVGIAPFLYCPAINRASAGGRLLGSVPTGPFFDHDGLGTLGVVMQRENWLIVQVCLVYLDEPDGLTHDTKRGDLLKKNLTN